MDLSASGSSQMADACNDGRSNSVRGGASTQKRSPLASDTERLQFACFHAKQLYAGTGPPLKSVSTCNFNLRRGNTRPGRWVPCHHGMARPQVVHGGDGLQIWRIAANI
jgi:hypothetical protein